MQPYFTYSVFIKETNKVTILMRYYAIALLLLLATGTAAQDYERAIGVRGGVTAGVLYKHFLNDEKANYSMFSYKLGGVQFTFIRQYHEPIFLDFTQQWFFYYGIGGHAGYAKYSNQTYFFNGVEYRKREFSVGVSIDANLGFEYHSIKYPVAVCIDFRPYFEVNVPQYFRRNYYDVGLIVYYTF